MSRHTIDDLTTPAARAIVRRLASEGDAEARLADDGGDSPAYAQALHAAKRDTYRLVARWIVDDLRDVEREAVDIETSENARIDALLEGVA